MLHQTQLAQSTPDRREIAPPRLFLTPAGTLRAKPAVLPKVAVPWLLWPLLVYLAAVLIIGKGPTYLGYPPFYWGEAVLFAAIIWMLSSRSLRMAVTRGITGLSVAVVLYIVLGVVLTLRSFSRWPTVDVLRDAAAWYYASLYFVGLAIGKRPKLAQRIWSILSRFWVLALVWGLANFISGDKLSQLGPMLAGRDYSLLSNSGCELVQNMALGAFIVLANLVRAPFRWAAAALQVTAFAGLAAGAAVEGRGVKVGVGMAILAAVLLCLGRGRLAKLQKRLPMLILVSVLALGAYAAISEEALARITHADRFSEISLEQRSGTAWWRVLWWQRLEDDVMAQNPLFGLGFGQSLGVYNPFLVGDDQTRWPVRSPHNFNMTVFARMGIVGSAAWALILVLGPGVLFVRLWKNGFRGRRYRGDRKEELLFWLAMLLATWGDASFGVLLEGPVLAVPFWFALGFAMARSVDAFGLVSPVPRRCAS
jgi:hypothetical protein